MLKQVIIMVVIVAAGNLVMAEDKAEQLATLLKRLLTEESKPSCSNYYSGKERATRGLKFTACKVDGDCKSAELCCPSRFLPVCIAKSSLMGSKDQGAVVTPPKDSVPLDDAPSDLCSSLPKTSLAVRGLSKLVNMLDKRVPLISTTSCTNLNKQDVCTTAEVCCDSPVGPSCYPLSDTSAGSKKWCPGAKLC